ncbi:hypothetical protein GF314_06915 [bacterium]|nr:hypothetical protein [bacterium]
MLGINPGPDPLETLEVFVDAFQITFPILLDDHTVHAQYRQPGPQSPFPLDYVIDQDGLVAYHATEYQPAAMVAVIEDLLAIETAIGGTPPSTWATLDAAPNPFNPRTRIVVELDRPSRATLDVVDARGRRVRRLLADRPLEAGRHDVGFDGRDGRGRELPTGVYLARLELGDGVVARKLTLVR